MSEASTKGESHGGIHILRSRPETGMPDQTYRH